MCADAARLLNAGMKQWEVEVQTAADNARPHFQDATRNQQQQQLQDSRPSPQDPLGRSKMQAMVTYYAISQVQQTAVPAVLSAVVPLCTQVLAGIAQQLRRDLSASGCGNSSALTGMAWLYSSTVRRDLAAAGYNVQPLVEQLDQILAADATAAAGL